MSLKLRRATRSREDDGAFLRDTGRPLDSETGAVGDYSSRHGSIDNERIIEVVGFDGVVVVFTVGGFGLFDVFHGEGVEGGIFRAV